MIEDLVKRRRVQEGTVIDQVPRRDPEMMPAETKRVLDELAAMGLLDVICPDCGRTYRTNTPDRPRCPVCDESQES